MGGLNSGPGPGITLLIAIVIVLAHKASSAPLYEDEEGQESNSQALVESHGCYYNFQHYNEGERILTNEPCLNCTCRNRMLMCYLRVCPFTKGIGQNCTVEKVPGQCCPIITCPEVPVQLLTSTTTEGIKSPGSYHGTKNTAVGHLDTNGCNIDGVFYPNGAQVPGAPEKPCELCYCIRNKTACIMQECALHVDGCRPIYEEGQCFPVRYQCDDSPYEEELTTTIRPPPTPGLVITTTSSEPLDCAYNNDVYDDGSRIQTEDPCEHCYCLKGKIACAVQECGAPLEKEGQNCTALPPAPGKCCPDSYQCDNNVIVQAKESFLRKDRKQKFEPKVIENNDVTMTSQGLSHEGTTKPGIPSVADAGHPTHGYHPDGTSETTEYTTDPLKRVTTSGTHPKGTEDVKPELDKGTQPDGHFEELRPMKPGSTSDSDQKITFPDEKESGITSVPAIGRPDQTKEPESSDHTTEGHVIHTANEKQPHPESESHKTDPSASTPIQGTGAKHPTDMLKPAGTTDPLLDKLHNIIQDVQAQVSDGKTTEMPEQVDYQTTTPIQTGHFTEKPDILSHLPHLGFQSSTPNPVESGSNKTDTKPPEDGNDIINKLQGIIHGIYSHVTDSILSSKQPESTTETGGAVTKEPIDSVGLHKPNKEGLQPHGSSEEKEKPKQPLRPKPEDSEYAHTTESAQEQGGTKIPLTGRPQDSSQPSYGFTSDISSGQTSGETEPENSEGVKPGQPHPGGVSTTEENAEGLTSTHYLDSVKPGQKYPEGAIPTEQYPNQYPTERYPEGAQPGQNYPDRLRPTEEYPEGETSTGENLGKLKPGQTKDKVSEVGKPQGEYPELIKQPGEYPEKLKPGQPTDKLPELMQTGQYHPDGQRPTEEYPVKVTPTGEYPEEITSGQYYSTGKPGQKYPEEVRPTGQYPGGVKPGEKYPDSFQPTEKHPEGVRPWGQNYPEGTKPGQIYPESSRPTEEYPEGVRPSEQYPGVKPGHHYPEGTKPEEKYSEKVTPSGKYPEGTKPTEEYHEGQYPEGIRPTGTMKPSQEKPTKEYPEGVTSTGQYPDRVRPTEQYPDGIRPGQHYIEGIRPGEKHPDSVKPNVHYPEEVKPGQKYPDGVKPTEEYPDGIKPTENFAEAISSTEHYPEGVSSTDKYLEVKPGQHYPEKIRPGQKYPEGHYPEEVKPTGEFPKGGKPGQKYPNGFRPTEEYPEGIKPTGQHSEEVKPGQHFPQEVKPGQKYPEFRPTGESLESVKPGQKYPQGTTEEYPEEGRPPTELYPEGVKPGQKYPDDVNLSGHYPDGVKPGVHYPEQVRPTGENLYEGKPGLKYPDGVRPAVTNPETVTSTEQYTDGVTPVEYYPDKLKPDQHYPQKKPGEKYPDGVKPTEEYPESVSTPGQYSEGFRPTQKYPDTIKPEQHGDGGKPEEKYPFGVKPTGEYPQGEKQGQHYPEGLRPTGEHPEEGKPTEKYPAEVKPGQYPDGVKPGQHYPEEDKLTEKYPEGSRPEEEYSEGVTPTEHYPEEIRPTEKYPEGNVPGQHYPSSVKPGQKYPDEHYPEEIRPTEVYPEKVKPGQKYPDNVTPTEHSEGIRPTDMYPEGFSSTGYYPEGVRPTEKYPEGVKPGQRYPDRKKPGQEYPDGSSLTGQYPEGVSSTGQYLEGIIPTEEYPEGVQPGRFPDRTKPGERYPDGIRPTGEYPTEHNPDRVTPTEHYPEEVKPGQKYPTEEYPDAAKPTEEYPEGVKPEQPYPVEVKPGEKYPERVKPDQKYPAGVRPTEEYPEEVRPSGQYPEDYKPGQHYPVGVKPGQKYPGGIKPSEQSPDGVKPGQYYPESVKPTDEYPEEVKPGQHYPEKIRPTGEYPEGIAPTENYSEELNPSEKYPEGVRPTGQNSEGVKVGQQYPERLKPGQKYPDGIRPAGEHPVDNKHPLGQKPHSPAKYPETSTESGFYSTAYPDDFITTDIPDQFGQYPAGFKPGKPGKPGVHGPSGITVKPPESSTKYTDLLTPEEESKFPDGYKPHGQKPTGTYPKDTKHPGATEVTAEGEDHTNYPEEQTLSGQYSGSSKHPSSTDKHTPKPVVDHVAFGTESPETTESTGNSEERPDGFEPSGQKHPVTGKPDYDSKYPEGSKPIGHYPDSSEKPSEYPESFKPTGAYPQDSKVTRKPSIKHPQRPKPGSVDESSGTEYPENEVEDELSTSRYPVKGRPEYGTEYPSETTKKPGLIKRPYKPKPGDETEPSETETQPSPFEEHGKPGDAEHDLKHSEKKPLSGSDQPEKPEDDFYGTEYPTDATGRPELYPGVSRRPTGSHKRPQIPNQVGTTIEPEEDSDITGRPQFVSEKHPLEKFKPTEKYPERPTVTDEPQKYPHKKPSENEPFGTEHPETPGSKYPDKIDFGRPQTSHTEESETDKPHKSYTTEKTYVTEYPEKPSPPNAEDQLLESDSKSTSRPYDSGKYPEDPYSVKEGNKTGVTGRPDSSKHPHGTEAPDAVPELKPEDYTKHPEGIKHSEKVPDDSTKLPEGSKVTEQSKYPEGVRPHDSEAPNKTGTESFETQTSHPEGLIPTGHHPGLTGRPHYSTKHPEDGKPYGTEHSETEGTGRPHHGSKYPHTTKYPETGEADETTHYPEGFKPTAHYPDRPQDHSNFPEGSEYPQSTGFPEVYHPEKAKPGQDYSDKTKPKEKYPDGVRPTEGYLDGVTEQYLDNARPTGQYSEGTKPEIYPEGVASTEGYPEEMKPGQKYPDGVRPTEEYLDSAKPTKVYPSGVRPTDKYSEGEKPGQKYPEGGHPTGTYPDENKFTDEYPDSLKPTEEYPDRFKPGKPYHEKVKPGQKYPGIATSTEEYPDGVTSTEMYPHGVRPVEGFPDGIKPGQSYPEAVKPGQKYPAGVKPTDQYPEGVHPANKHPNGTKPDEIHPDFARPEKNKPTEEYSEGTTSTGQYPEGFKPTQKYPEGFKPGGHFPEVSKPHKHSPDGSEPGQKFPESGRPTGEYPEEIKPTGAYPEGIKPTGAYPEGVKPGQHYPQGIKPGQKYPDDERPTEEYPDEGRPTEKYPESFTPTDRYPEGFKPDQQYPEDVKPEQHYPDRIKPGEKYPDGIKPTGGYPDSVTSTEQYPDGVRPIGHYPAGVRPTEHYPEELKPSGEHPEKGKPEQQHPEGLRPNEENPEGEMPTEHYPEGIKPSENYPEGTKPGHYPEGVKPGHEYPDGVKPGQKYPDVVKPDQYPERGRPTEQYPEHLTSTKKYPEGIRPTEQYPEGLRPGKFPEGVELGQKYPDEVHTGQKYPIGIKPTDEYPEGFSSTGHYTENMGETEQYPEEVKPGHYYPEGVKPEQKYPEGVRPTGENPDEETSGQTYPEGISSTGKYPERVTPTEESPDGVRPVGHYPNNVRPGQHYPERKPDQNYPDNVKPTEEYPDEAKPTEEYPEEVTATEQYPEGFRPTQTYPERVKPGQHYPAGGKPVQKYPQGIKPTVEYPDEGKPTKEYTTKPTEKYPGGVRPTDQYSVPQHVKPGENYSEAVKPEQTYPDGVTPTDDYSNEGTPTEKYPGGVKPEEQHPAGEHQVSKHPVRGKPGKPQTSGKPFYSESPYGTESPEDYASGKPDDGTKYPDGFSSTVQYPGRPETSHYPVGSGYLEIGGTDRPEENFSPSENAQQSTKYPEEFEPHGTTYPESFGITHKPTRHPDGVESATKYTHISGVTKVRPGHEEQTDESVPESTTEYSEGPEPSHPANGQTGRPKYPIKSKPEETLEGSTSRPEDGDKHLENFRPTGEYPYGSKVTSTPQGVSKYPQKPKPGSESDASGAGYFETTRRPASTSESGATADVTEYPEEAENSSLYSSELKPTSGEKFGVTGRPHASTKHPELKPEPGVSYYPDGTDSTKYPVEESESTEYPEVGFTGKPGQSKYPVTVRPDDKHSQKTTPSKLGDAVDSEYGTEYPGKAPGGLIKYPQAPEPSGTEQPGVIDIAEHFGTVPKRPTQRPKPGESENEPSGTKYPEDETSEQPEGTEKPFGTSEYSERPKPGSEYPGEAGTTKKPIEDGEYPDKTGYLTSRPLLGKPRPTVSDESSVTSKPDSDKHPLKVKPEDEYYGTEHPGTTGIGSIDESEVHTGYPDKPGEQEKNTPKPMGSELTSEAPEHSQKHPDGSVDTAYSEGTKYPSTTRPPIPSKYPQAGETNDVTEHSVTFGTEYPKVADNVIKPDERVTGIPDSQKHPQRPKPTGSEGEPYGTEYPEIRPSGATERPDKYPQKPQTTDWQYGTTIKYPGESEKLPPTEYPEAGKPGDKYPDGSHSGVTEKLPEEQKPFGSEYPQVTGVAGEDLMVTPTSSEKVGGDIGHELIHQQGQYPTTSKPGVDYLPQGGESSAEGIPSSEHLDENALPESTSQTDVGFTDRIPVTEESDQEDLLTTLHHFTGHQDKPSSADLTHETGSLYTGQHSTTKQPDPHKPTYTSTANTMPAVTETTKLPVSVNEYPERPKPIVPGEGLYNPIKDHESSTHSIESLGTIIPENKKPDQSSVNKYPSLVQDPSEVDKYPERVSTGRPEEYTTQGSDKVSTGYAVSQSESEGPSSANRHPEEQQVEEGTTPFFATGGFTKRPGIVAPEKTDYLEKESTGDIQTTTPSDDDLINKLHNIISGIQFQVTDGKTTKLPHEGFDSTTPSGSVTSVLQTTVITGKPEQKPQQPSRTPGTLPSGNEVDEHTDKPHYPFVGGSTQQSVTIPEKGPAGIQPTGGDEQNIASPVSETKGKPGAHTQDTETSYPDEHSFVSKQPFDEFPTTFPPDSNGVSELSGRPSTPGEPNSSVNEVTTGTYEQGISFKPIDSSSPEEKDQVSTLKPFTGEHLQTVTPQDMSHKHPSSSTDKPLHVVYPTYYPDGVVTRKPGTKPDEESDKKVTVTPQSAVHGEVTTKTPESGSTVESHTVYDVQTEISSEPGTSPVVIVHEVHTEVHSERATTKPETEGYYKPTSQPESSQLPEEEVTRQPGIIQPSSISHILQPHAGQPTQQSELTTKPALYTVTPIGSIPVTKESEHIMHLYSSKDKHSPKTTSPSPESFTTASPTYPEDVKHPEQVTFGVPDKHFITNSPVGTTFRPEILGTRFPSRKTTQKPGAPIFQESSTMFPTEGIDDYQSSPVTGQPVVISTEGLPDGTFEDKHTTADYFFVTDATKQPSQGASYVPYKLVNGTKVYYPEKELPQRPETDSSPFDGYDQIPYEVVNGTKLFYPNRVVTKRPGQPITTSTPTGMLVPYKIVNGTKVYYTEEVPEKPESFDGIDFVPFDVVNGTKVFYPERVTTTTPPGSAMYVPFKIVNGTKMYYPQDAEEEPENIPDEYDGFDYIPYDLIDGNKVFHPDRIPGHVPVTEQYPAMYVPYKLVNGNKVYYPNEAQTEPESVPDEYDGFDLVPYELLNGTKFFHLDRMTTPAPIPTTTMTPAMFVPFRIINGTKVYFPKLAQKKPTHSSDDFDGFDYLPYEEVNGTKVFSPERATPRPEYTSTPAFYSNGMFVPYKIINNRKVFFPQDAQQKPRPLKPGYDGVQYLPYDVINGTKVFHPEKVTSKPSAMYIPYKLVNGTKVYYADKATENQDHIPGGYDGFDYVPYEVINGNKVFYPDRVVPTTGMFVPYKKTNGTKVYHPKDATEKLHRVPPGYDGVDYIPYEVINGTKVFHPEKAAPAHPPPTMYVPFRIINGTKVYFPKDAQPKPHFPEGYDGADTLPYEVVNGTKVFHPEEVPQAPTPASTPALPQGMFVPYKVINGTKVYFTQEAHKRPHPLSDEYAGLDYVPYEVVNGTKVFHPEKVSSSAAPTMYVPYKIVNGTKVFYPKNAQHDPQQIPQEYDGFDYVPYDTVNGIRVFHLNRIPSYPGLYVPYKIIKGQKVFYPNRAQHNPLNFLDGYDGFDYLPYDTVNGTKVFKPVETTTEIPLQQAMYVPYKIINGTKVFYPKHAQFKPYLIPEGFDGFEYIPYKIVNGNKVFEPELAATPGTPYKPAMYVPFKIVNGTKVYYPKYAQPKPELVPEGYDGFDYVPYEIVDGTKVFHPEQAVTPGTPFRPAMYVPFKIVNGKKVYYPKHAQPTTQSVPEGYDGFDYVPYEVVNGTKVFRPEQAVTPGTPSKPAMYVPFKIVNDKKVYYPKRAQQKPQYVPEGFDGFDYVPYEVINGSKVFHPEEAVTPLTPFKPAMYVPYKIVAGKKVYNPKQAQTNPTTLPEGYDGLDYLPYDLINGNKVFYPEESTPVKEAMYVPYKLVNGTKVFYPKHAQYIPSQTPEGYDGFEYIPYVLVNGEKVFLPEQTVTPEPPFKKALYVPYKVANGTKVYYPKNAQHTPYLIPPGYDGYDYLPYEDVNGNKVFHPEQAIPSETPSRQAMYVPFKIVNGTKVYYPKHAKPKPQQVPDGYDGFDYLPYDVVNGTKVFDPKAPSKPTHLQGMYVPYKLSNNTKVFYPKDAYNKPNYVPEGYDGADYVPYEPVNNTKMFYPELISTTQPINSGTQGVYVPFKLVNNKKVFYPKEATPFPPTVSYPYDGVAFVPYKTGTRPSEIVYVDDDDTLKPHQPSVQPGYVPGEGSCYLNNKTYANNTEIPPVSPCQAKCMCLSSVVRCVRVKCPAPPENRLDCSPVYREGSCCPTYACGDSEYATTVGYPETVPESSASSLYGHGIVSTTPFTDSAQKRPSSGSAVPSEEYHLHRPPKPKPEHESLEPYDSVEGHLSPEEDYDVEDEEPYGPGTCRYAGKVYVSAQQIPRDDPCDFCFCFRSDIICLQQSCPPPIPGCRDEPIQGFCCPRYECHVKTATIVNMTSTTTTTTTTLPPHFLRKPIKGWSPGCVVQGKAYRVGTAIPSASGPCMDCFCGGNGRMQCEPKVCTPEPIIRKMISPTENATVSANER